MPGGGTGERIAFTLLIFEAGVRLIATAAPSPEVQAALTLGIGLSYASLSGGCS